MAMIINTNVMAINAQRNLSITSGKLGKALEQLSSGQRINRSADDAAGLAISEKMRSLIRGLQQGSRNGQDGISMIQTAEGALSEVHNILQRMRELAVQAGNSTLSTSDRTAIGEEMLTLRNEIDNIAARTKFNGLNLLTGSLSTSQSGGTLITGLALRLGEVESARRWLLECVNMKTAARQEGLLRMARERLDDARGAQGGLARSA
jgi:flagellin